MFTYVYVPITFLSQFTASFICIRIFNKSIPFSLPHLSNKSSLSDHPRLINTKTSILASNLRGRQTLQTILIDSERKRLVGRPHCHGRKFNSGTTEYNHAGRKFCVYCWFALETFLQNPHKRTKCTFVAFNICDIQVLIVQKLEIQKSSKSHLDLGN